MQGYGFEHEGRVFTPDGDATIELQGRAAEHNRQLSEAECEAFRNRSADRWFAYVRPWMGDSETGQLTTWVGDKLADFEWVSPEYHCPAFGPFPSTRRNLRARGIDGRE